MLQAGEGMSGEPSSIEPNRRLAAFMAVTLITLGCSGAVAASTPMPVSVEVPRHPSNASNLTISFKPREPLPVGGYYYGAAVLTKHYAKRLSLKRCAQASDMQYTEYGYPGPGKPVSLALMPEKVRLASGATRTLDWCPGATYRGAVYAIPHGKPCGRDEPCYGHSTAPECYSGEPLCSNGKRLFGKPFAERLRQPGQLPRPRDGSARVVAYFRVQFANR